jgi:hypothetical protein
VNRDSKVSVIGLGVTVVGLGLALSDRFWKVGSHPLLDTVRFVVGVALVVVGLGIVVWGLMARANPQLASKTFVGTTVNDMAATVDSTADVFAERSWFGRVRGFIRHRPAGNRADRRWTSRR